MKRVWCMLLICCMMLSFLPVSARADWGTEGMEAGTDRSAADAEAAADRDTADAEAAADRDTEGAEAVNVVWMEPGIQQGGLLPQPTGDAALMDTDTEALEELTELLRARAAAWDGSAEDTFSVADSYYTVDMGQKARNLIQNRPEFFYIQTIGFSYYPDNTIVEFTIQFNTEYSPADIETFYHKADDILSQIEDTWSDEQKALWLHDYLVTHIRYYATPNDGNQTIFNAYGALINGSAVCQGYALAFQYLAEKLGMPCKFISSNQLVHAWNLLWVNGTPYYVDCTWDDPTDGYDDYCGHKNFLINQEELWNTGHKANDWTDGETWLYNSGIANKAYGNSWWQNCASVIPHVGNLWAFCVDGENEIYVHDYGTGQDTILCTHEAVWPVFGATNTHWTSNYTSLCADGASFYASGPTAITKISTDGRTESFYELSNAEKAIGFLYGIRIEDDTLVYNLGKSRDDSGTRYFIPILPSDYPEALSFTLRDGQGNTVPTVSGIQTDSSDAALNLSINPADVKALDSSFETGGIRGVFCAVYDRAGKMVLLNQWEMGPDDSDFIKSITIPQGTAVREIKVMILNEDLVPVCAAAHLT